MNVEHIIDMARQAGASDVHLVCGLPVKFRLAGRLENAGVDGDAPLSHDDCEQLARRLAGDDFDRIKRIGELDRAETIGGVRVRINLFRQQGHVSAALRLLSDRIPALETLGLPPAVMDFPRIQRGIVVVTGETGSGKSTTLAALIDSINHTRAENIITMEDPIEYVYTPDQSVISQREIGQDTESYSNALRAVLREDPDVVLIGEMRDLDTIQTALTAAETGHFVLATLHTKSAADSIDRMVDVFPEGLQRQVRMQLSTTLVAVLSQQLLPRRDGTGRALACELMMVTPAIRNLLREGKDVAFIAVGDTVRLAIDAAKALHEQGIEARVLDMHTIKPLDEAAVNACIADIGKIVTIEDHNKINGLGSAVCECVAEAGHGIVRRVGIQDQFGESAPYERLLAKNGITVENIVAQAKAIQ